MSRTPLIISIAENSGSVTVSFLGANGRISLGLAMLAAAAVGAVADQRQVSGSSGS
jgi:uncharacterized integral membrane protein